MKNERKVTVMLPEELIKRATKASGEGLTPTLRRGLELIAAKDVYKGLLERKGKYPKGIGIDLKELRKARE